jgi:hypothetical protein
MEDYESLFAACLAAMDGPLPEACLKTHECRIAGGCPLCYAPLLTGRCRLKFEIRAIEERFDRHEDHRVFGTPLPRIH